MNMTRQKQLFGKLLKINDKIAELEQNKWGIWAEINSDMITKLENRFDLRDVSEPKK